MRDLLSEIIIDELTNLQISKIESAGKTSYSVDTIKRHGSYNNLLVCADLHTALELFLTTQNATSYDRAKRIFLRTNSLAN